MFDKYNASAIGMLKIKDKETGTVLRDKTNAIHFANLSRIIALGLAGRDEGHMRYMCFGNGGSSITPAGTIFYRTPNTSIIYDETADLYNETYSKDLLTENTEENNISVLENTNSNYTDIVFTCTLGFGEPSGQNLSDNSPNIDTGEFVFDEIGIKSSDVNSYPALLLTHVIFSPLEKSLNRVIEIEYVVRIQMG